MITIRSIWMFWLLATSGFVLVFSATKRIPTAIQTDILSVDEPAPEPNHHLATRLLRYFIFGGIIQAISAETRIPRRRLVFGGRSMFQDKHSQAGPGTHAAHVVRVCAINAGLTGANPNLTIALQNYIGHTQDVPRIYNYFAGVGGAIDLFQSSSLKELSKIDFTGFYNGTNKDTVIKLSNAFRGIVEKYARKENQATVVIDVAKAAAYCADPSLLFARGTEGHRMVVDGTFLRNYYTPNSTAVVIDPKECHKGQTQTNVAGSKRSRA
nr:hyp37.7-like precursor [Anopheles gambiae]